MVNTLRAKYATVDAAEDELMLNIDSYIDSSYSENDSVLQSDSLHVMPDISLDDVISFAQKLDEDSLVTLTQKLFDLMLAKKEIIVPEKDFITLSLSSMAKLKVKNKSNIVYKLANIIAKDRLPLDRMPFGLLQYNIDFFNCMHVKEVRSICLVQCYADVFFMFY